jgi:hypothetical protein
MSKLKIKKGMDIILEKTTFLTYQERLMAISKAYKHLMESDNDLSKR